MEKNKLLYKLYKIKKTRLRNFIISRIKKLEGGELYSITLRKIFKDYHKVEIGMYTYGGCFVIGQIHPYTTIGKYCTIARKIRILNRYHPLDFKSTHAMFCVTNFGFCEKDLVDYLPLSIGNDVWIGHNAVITRNVTQIGDGAVICAGAIVHKNVPPYAIFMGNPGRIIKYRFSQEVIEKLLASCWWEKSIEEIKPDINEFQKPYII